jgi:hypothetical protein
MFILDSSTITPTFLGRKLGQGYWGVPNYPSTRQQETTVSSEPATTSTKTSADPSDNPYASLGADRYGTFLGVPTA